MGIEIAFATLEHPQREMSSSQLVSATIFVCKKMNADSSIPLMLESYDEKPIRTIGPNGEEENVLFVQQQFS